MKMPSTYINLLLLCGFMYVFYLVHHTRHTSRPAIKHPVVKATKPVVKRFLPGQLPAVPLDKNYDNEKDTRKALLNESGFSFFKDVVCHIAPLLKNVR
jgi:hypothetical protein